MSRNKHIRRIGLRHNIRSLWKYWALSVGSLSIPTLLSPIVAEKFMPLILLSIVIGLMAIDRHNRLKKSPDCFRQPFIIVVSLVITAAAIAVSVFIDPDVFRSPYPGADTPNPFLMILVLGPSSLLVSIYYMIRGNNPSYCKACMARNGDSIDRGFIGAIFHRETAYQGRLYFVISLVITIVTWIYYALFYVEINVNPSDQFYFVAFPVAIYIFSLVYLGSRYYSMWNFYSSDPKMSKMIERKGTTLRYIIIYKEDILLSAPSAVEENQPLLSDDLKIDTPAVIRIEHQNHTDFNYAKSIFSDKYGISDFHLQYLYESHDYSMMNNVIHYAAFVESDECGAIESGEWFSFGEVVRMIKSGMISNALTVELKRITTIALTAKTYDADGNRIYPIKHYRPTFSLSDLRKLGIDYNDNKWLAIAETNADKRFFRIRRFWKRFVKGVGV